LRDFFDRLNAIGNIPIALAHWQLTGVNTLSASAAGPADRLRQ
jgi:hypothetical protein